MRNRHEAQNFESDSLDGYNSKLERAKVSIHSISSATVIISTICCLLSVFIVKVYDEILPTPLAVSDENSNPDAFISERAIHDLKLLTSLGSRVSGSYENEALAFNFFKREIAFIEQRAHSNQKMEVNFQIVSGSYFIDFKPNGAIHAYSKIQNIIVKLHGKSSARSLLLNSHFDTVPNSPGGSDNGINCAIMLEILRKLSRSPKRLENNIIFLFNGAEEAGLKAAHGFITQHKWANEIGAFINLEAAGAGGKEYLFQSSTNHPWMLNYYKKVPHPTGQVIGEELFQNGIIPSDTDYRIFRDFKNISGLDFAFIANGYRYHTKYDDFDHIPNGTYQHAGNNILKLTTLIGNGLELLHSEELPEKLVFFDVFGYFVMYKYKTAIVINVVATVASIILALFSFFNYGVGATRQSLNYLLITFVVVLSGWVISGIFVAFIAVILDIFGSTMSWYGNKWFVFGLYISPSVACCSLVTLIWNRFNENFNLSIAVQTQLQLHAVRLVWSLVLLLGTFYQIRSCYLLLIPIVFQTITFIFIRTFKYQHSVQKWQLIYVCGMTMPYFFLINIWQTLISVLIPICGRLGSTKNPELMIGFYSLLFTILILSYYIPFITLVNKGSTVVKLLFGVFIVTFVIITVTPVGFPYNDDDHSPTPQRYWVYHTSRTFRNDSNHVVKKNSGFFILNWDRNAPNAIKNHVKALKRITSIADDCNQALFCGLPLASSRVVGIIRESAWIPAGQPVIHEPTNLKLISKNNISDTITRFNFFASGPSHLHIAISARHNATLTAISLVDKLPTDPILWNERLTYVILHTWGVESVPLSFTLDFELRKGWREPVFDIAISGRCMHDRTNIKTPQFVQFLNDFPKWTDVVPYLATYESWVY